MSFYIWIVVGLVISLNISASVALKKFAMTSQGRNILDVSVNGFVFLGGAIFFYGVSFVFYAVLLKYFPVSKAYSVVTFGAQVGIIVAGILLFGEKLNLLAWCGVVTISFGVLLMLASTEL